MKSWPAELSLVFLGLSLTATPGRAQATYTPYDFITIAGDGSFGSADGTGYGAQFASPDGVAVDKAGNAYVADAANNMIRKIAPGAVVTTLAGSTNAGTADGAGSAAEFSYPTAVAVDGAGNVYVADTGNHTIRQVTPGGDVTTLAGQAGSPGSADGIGSAAQFDFPQGIAVDNAGNVYVADTGNHTIRLVTPGGAVKTLAGQPGNPGSADGTGTAAQFRFPEGIAVDSDGNVYVADTENHTIRKISSGGVVTTIAGVAGSHGSSDGTGSNSRFYSPSSVAVDTMGDIFVVDSANAAIRKVTTNGMVSTLGGAPGSGGGGLGGPVTYGADGAGYAARFRIPQGVAVDGAGNLFVVDQFDCTVRIGRPVDYTPYTFTTLAGLAGFGSGDGIGKAAQFSEPWGVAVDGAGNVYVTDYSNFTVRKVTPRGVVTTLAGLAGIPARTVAFGYPTSGADADGAGDTARFGYFYVDPFFGETFSYGPEGIAADGIGNLYVADTVNGTIRKITSDGVVTTFAGLIGSYGAQDGTGSSARFSRPETVAVDGAGNVYVADSYANLIRKISPDRVVKTIAGMAFSPGSVDGTNSTARFNSPKGIAVDSSGNVYVADTGNHTIRKISPAGVVTTLAGLVGNPGSADGAGSAARFDYPMGLAVDAAKNIYVADTDNSMLRKITPGGQVTTLAGNIDCTAVAVDAAGIIYVPDQYNNSIRKITPAGVVTTLAGNDGGGYAGFSYPSGVAADSAGNIYVADSDNHTIRCVAPNGATTTVAGVAGNSGSDDGAPSSARFYEPAALAVGPGGIVYVADTDNHTIRRIRPGGRVTTLAGLAGNSGSDDGTGSGARFYYPSGIAADRTNLFVADTYNNTIRKVSFDGVVTTLAGLAGTYGSSDGTGSGARFSDPYGIAVDSQGNVYVADADYALIRKISPLGVVTTLAGCATCPYGSLDGKGSDALFSSPWGIAVDRAGNVFVSDFYEFTIRKVTPAGVVTTVAGLAGSYGSADGTGSAAQFGNTYFNFFFGTDIAGPAGMAIDRKGNLYVADPINNTIRKGSPENPAPFIHAASPGSGIYTGQFGFILEGPDGRTAVIEASTNLTQWRPILTNTFAGPLDFNDPQSRVLPKRFYRARIP